VADAPVYRTIIRLPSFERSVKSLLSEEEQRWVDNTVGERPEAGAVMRDTGGVRKLRVALPGRGKSGGARVIYYYRGAKERVFLILAYPKNEKENLTGAERSGCGSSRRCWRLNHDKEEERRGADCRRARGSHRLPAR